MITRLAPVLLAGMLAAGAAEARQRRAIPDPSMFAEPPCSVFDPRPCTPGVCSPLQRGQCLPELQTSIGENLQLTVLSRPREADRERYQAPDHPLDTIADLFAALRACWTPPSGAAAGHELQMAVRFSLKKDGALMAPPRLTYASKDATVPMRQDLRDSIEHSLAGCTPLSLTPGFGGALAGRPIMVRYVDNRPMAQP